MKTPTCPICGVNPRRVWPSGRVGNGCAECLAAQKRAQYAARPEHYIAKAREWQVAHNDEVAERRRQAYAQDVVAQRARGRAYREANLDKSRRQVAAYSRAHRNDVPIERRKARQAVNNALRDRRLARKPCGECGEPRVQAHHFMGYDYEHRLTVEWLCVRHHAERHWSVAA